jgi:hypothetical protein
MKKNKLVHCIIPVFLLFHPLFIQAQGPGKWSTPKPHPCYSGIGVSVVNMGKGSGDNDYLWGVKFTNFYTTGVTFRYKLSIGEKITSKYGGDLAPLKKKGDKEGKDIWIDGNDKFRAKLYHNPSEEWYVYIWDVCFEGMRCGGSDECYADCDKDMENPKPNQPCGLSASPSLNAPEINNEPKEMSGTEAGPEKEEDDDAPNIGEKSNWERDDKKVDIMMGKTEKGIYWKRKNDKQYTFFEKLPSGAYRYEVGNDTYIIRFVSATKIEFSENGTVTNHYNLIAEEDDGESKVRSGIWMDGGSKVKIVVQKDGLTYDRVNTSCMNCSQFFKRISATEYREYNRDGILFCTLKLKEDEKLHYTCNDKPDSYVGMGVLTFLSADEEDKITNEEDKYSFKGTTLWKKPNSNEIKQTFALMDKRLYHVNHLGFPVGGFFDETKSYSHYRRMNPDTYRMITNPKYRKNKNDSLTYHYYHKFISNDKLVTVYEFKRQIDTGYYKKARKGKYEFIVTGQKDTLEYKGDTLVLAATLTAESLPQKGTTQIVTPADATGIWRSEDKLFASFEDYKVRITPLGENMLCNFGKEDGLGKITITYKKISVNTYEYKENSGAICRLLFLSPTRICLSNVYKNYVSIGYYNKPAAPPIVKQENNPVTVEKGKVTVWRCNEGGEHEMEMKDDGLYFSAIYPDEDRSKSAYFNKVSATTYIYISKISGGHRVVFQGEGRMYYESYNTKITTRPFDTHCDYYLVK